MVTSSGLVARCSYLIKGPPGSGKTVLAAHLRRLFSIVKVRQSDYDGNIREFLITPRGIQLSDSFKNAESVMSGYAQRRRLFARLGRIKRKNL